MIKTLNVLFYIRKDKIDKNGDAPIYCRITYNKERSDFTIQIRIQVCLNCLNSKIGKLNP